ncbi:aminotransferase-like domain-containing protein [Phaeobacter marinintestinus]|uniref:aminotransferase-like domain-containing protein n=1 Tax=Falsiphaeobacter marinintestinus TaxID=1492905 RepID=UPI0011B743B8|nr:PLP-dependent aminotransferase family protein [Phaeobacter marinintestinus]
MSFEISALFRPKLPAPASARFKAFPTYNFVGGHNDAASIPVEALTAAAARVIAREGKSLATYGLNSGPQGYRPLREFIASWMAESADTHDSADEILITSGSLQALDLVNQLLVGPDDMVIAEEATYGGALTRLAKLGVPYLGVRLDDDGIDMSHLAELLESQKNAGQPVKFIYTIPTVQNPTGGVMPVKRRRHLLDLAARYNCLIFEDDCYADLVWSGIRPPTIRALDAEAAVAEGRSNRVIYCGSFSKSVAPALRIGFIMADWPVLAQILPLKTDAGTGALDQMVLAEFCKDQFPDHIARLRARLKSKCDMTIQALEEHFGTAAEFTAPLGGIFIWVTLPEGVDTKRLEVAALKEGIAINPGAEWTVDGSNNRRRMRLCFGNPEESEIRGGIARLAEICHREFGVPERISNIEQS